MIAQLFGIAGIFMLALTPTPVVNGRCEGVGTQAPGAAPKFACVPVACVPGCVKSAVATPFGAGEVCNCNYIGPQPNCCKLVFVPGAGGFTKQGDCLAPGCLTAGVCSLIIVPGVAPAPFEFYAKCVVPPVDATD